MNIHSMQKTQQFLRHIQQSFQKVSPSRWVLLAWIGFIYLWGILWGGGIKEQIGPPVVLLFTVLMVLHFSLYGVNSFRHFSSQRSRFLYFTVQTLLIVLITLVARRFTVTLGLYLALVGEITSMLLTTRITLLVGASCLLLFSLNLDLLFGWEQVPILSGHLVPLHMALLYVLPAFLLVVGYALQQAHARAQTQSLLQELERAHLQLANDAMQLEELTRATERRRMARELHDTLAQGLAGLILQLEAVKAHLVAGRQERALEIVVQAMGRARSTLADARSAIDDLRTEPMSSTDLQQALEEEIDRFTTATGIPCTTHFASFPLVPEAFGESIARMLAEGLLNVARHAQASQVWVCTTQQNQELAIEVRDNGRGFDPATVTQQGHYGLPGLRERARLLGGQFVLLTAPGKGTTLRFLLPTTRQGEQV
jgi:NarL family two-component system sensor histidine kinase YdfH